MYRQFSKIILENRSWLALATLFFMGGTLFMYTALSQDPRLLPLMEETALTMLKELAEQVFSGHPLRGVAILFLNNTFASLQAMVLGVFLGVAPLFSAMANGAILGTVAFQLTHEFAQPLPLLLAGILPHGVFEIPAFLVSVALGLKLGYHLIFPLPGHSRHASLKGIWKEIGNVLPMIFLLLFLAAMIEVFITPAVLAFFLPR
ncbi:MAG: stage II sporulation protein M [Clostridium sp.]|nr:stage II sporulation protein M [Clostridium sp.]